MNEYQTIEVFFGDRIIFLTDQTEDFYAHFKNRKQLSELVKKFENSEYDKLYICHENLNELFTNFKSLFIHKKAAGGLVINSMRKILFIKNRGIWQLPKGHVEENETISDAAIREVMEETGISAPTIIKELPQTFHTFLKNGKMHLKQTFWFKMLYKGHEQLVPQTKENITDAAWLDKNDIAKIYDNIYPNLLKIIDLA
jgi:8-oxo-dGTP pyrophosphatase MutT (NUDIX family)